MSEVNYVLRTLLINAPYVELAREMCAIDPSGEGMFPRAYGDGETILGYISSGLTTENWDDIWPYTLYDSDGNITETFAGNASLFILTANMLKPDHNFTIDQVLAVFANCYVSNEEPFDVMAKLGLELM